MKTALLAILCACGSLFASINNMKVLTDNTPDWTDINSAAHSITDNWATDEEKAIALWKWIAPIRHQVTPAHDAWSNANVPGGHPSYGCIYNPIKLANNYGNTFCVTTNSIPARLFKALGKTAREYDINGHTVCDLSWGGAWHNFDPAFGFYYKDQTSNQILDCQTVVDRHTTASNMMSDATRINIFNLALTGNASIYQNKKVSDILVNTAEYSGIQATRTTLFSETYSDAYTYKLHLKPYESYTRRWTQVDSSNGRYYLPADGNGSLSGTNPNYNSSLTPNWLNIMSNGIWVFQPVLDNAKFLEAVGAETNLAQGGAVKIHPAAAGSNAQFTYRVDGANIICFANVSGQYVRTGSSDVFQIHFSSDSTNWTQIYSGTGTGTQSFSQDFGVSGGGGMLARTREYYFIRVTMNASGTATNCGLNTLKVTTWTIVNPRTIPRLTRGSNRVKFAHSGGTVEPFEVTYHFTEYSMAGTVLTPKVRSHKKTVTANNIEYYINTAGFRWPKMDSLRINWPGVGPAVPEGYNDGADPGPGAETPRYYYTFGRNIAVGKAVSATPTGSSMTALTDNAGGTGAALAGWSVNLNPEIVIDLGSAQNVAGIRLGEMGSDFLDSGIVSTSTDNSTWTRRGSFYFSQVWEPITNYVYQNTWDAPPSMVGRKNAMHNYFKFSCAFDAAASARYVKVKLHNAAVALALEELEVYGAMTKRLILNELNHGFTLPDLGATAAEKARPVKAGLLDLRITPNPMNASALIAISGLSEGQIALLSILGVDGRVVERASLTGPEHAWNAASLPPGVYVARVRAGENEVSQKLIVLK